MTLPWIIRGQGHVITKEVTRTSKKEAMKRHSRDGARGWECQQPPEADRGQGQIRPESHGKEEDPDGHLDFRILTSRTRRGCISRVLRFLVYTNLSEQP